eukprot:TRINITY_DN14872_c0_g1_i1.p1 TRINITY_DN14872_c0_g1~~TRINITY_DN14872_c0_g1_i1.p1  ORF type:complete len:296 (+),score=53.87 TRINITY_DN14872_c0_g1_i1:331-1218(+)
MDPFSLVQGNNVSQNARSNREAGSSDGHMGDKSDIEMEFPRSGHQPEEARSVVRNLEDNLNGVAMSNEAHDTKSAIDTISMEIADLDLGDHGDDDRQRNRTQKSRPEKRSRESSHVGQVDDGFEAPVPSEGNKKEMPPVEEWNHRYRIFNSKVTNLCTKGRQHILIRKQENERKKRKIVDFERKSEDLKSEVEYLTAELETLELLEDGNQIDNLKSQIRNGNYELTKLRFAHDGLRFQSSAIDSSVKKIQEVSRSISGKLKHVIEDWDNVSSDTWGLSTMSEVLELLPKEEEQLA